MKKILAMTLALVMLFSLAACGESPAPAQPEEPTAPSEPTQPEVPPQPEAPEEPEVPEEPELPAEPAAPSEGNSAEITWPDPVVGEVTGTLTLDTAAGEWELYYETPFGPYTLAGWYLPDGTMELTNDGGLGGFLDFAPIQAVASPAIAALAGAGGAAPAECSAEITWADPVVGEVIGTLTLKTASEEWELYYETPFGPYTLGGWYITADGSMGLTNDGGLGGFLDFAPIEAVAVPAIQQMVADYGLSAGAAVDPANCAHKWSNGECAVCKTPCAHDAWTAGVCDNCSYVCNHVGSHDQKSLLCSVCGIVGYHSFENGECACGATTIFEMNGVPVKYTYGCDRKGTVEEFTYETRSYALEAAGKGENIEITKKALVYLPYGYDPAQSYDILYLLHGGGDETRSQEAWFIDNPDTLNILDNMIKRGDCEPMIVVTPTFYSLAEGIDSSDVFAEYVENFGYEMMNELIPAIEAKYATYAQGDVSPENLKATRAHRAYAGLSMGSMTSFHSILNYCTDYFGYVGSYSAGPEADTAAALEAAKGIAENLNASGNEIYYWFNGNGVKDMAHDPHLATYPYMLEACPDVFTEGVNCCWVDYLEGIHDFVWWKLDLYNSLKVFFRVDEPGEVRALDALAQQGLLH